ncbi:MAG TPA: glutaredoxin family protein [Pseudoduganella sp.]
MDKEVVCPKCSHVRPQDATNPEWQCPACGVCYAKVGASKPEPLAPPEPSPSGNRKLARMATWIAICVALGAGYGQWHLTSRWKDVAKSVKPGDIVMYSYDGCVPASRAREHFRKYKIEFTECDIQKNEKCYRMLKLLNTEGIPTFVIYDKHVLQGFSENALYKALTQKK